MSVELSKVAFFQSSSGLSEAVDQRFFQSAVRALEGSSLGSGGGGGLAAVPESEPQQPAAHSDSPPEALQTDDTATLGNGREDAGTYALAGSFTDQFMARLGLLGSDSPASDGPA